MIVKKLFIIYIEIYLGKLSESKIINSKCRLSFKGNNGFSNKVLKK